MYCYDRYGNKVEFPKGIYVLVLIDSLYQTKTMLPHHSLLNWQKEYEEINVPVYIVSPDSSYIVKSGGYHYLYDESRQIFEDFHVIVDKTVFGQTKKIIQFSILLMDGDTVIKKGHRASPKAMANMYLKALEMRKKIIEKNVKKKLTENNHFVNI